MWSPLITKILYLFNEAKSLLGVANHILMNFKTMADNFNESLA
jgi:hypothetical protein